MLWTMRTLQQGSAEDETVKQIITILGHIDKSFPAPVEPPEYGTPSSSIFYPEFTKEKPPNQNSPLWQTNFKLFGKALHSSSSHFPVILTLLNVLYTATTPSSAPLRHSSMNSERHLALGVTSSANEARESNSLRAGALGDQVVSQ